MSPDMRAASRLKLRELHILMTVVDAGSMGKAADRLTYRSRLFPRRWQASSMRLACVCLTEASVASN